MTDDRTLPHVARDDHDEVLEADLTYINVDRRYAAYCMVPDGGQPGRRGHNSIGDNVVLGGTRTKTADILPPPPRLTYTCNRKDPS